MLFFIGAPLPKQMAAAATSQRASGKGRATEKWNRLVSRARSQRGTCRKYPCTFRRGAPQTSTSAPPAAGPRQIHFPWPSSSPHETAKRHAVVHLAAGGFDAALLHCIQYIYICNACPLRGRDRLGACGGRRVSAERRRGSRFLPFSASGPSIASVLTTPSLLDKWRRLSRGRRGKVCGPSVASRAMRSFPRVSCCRVDARPLVVPSSPVRSCDAHSPAPVREGRSREEHRTALCTSYVVEKETASVSCKFGPHCTGPITACRARKARPQHRAGLRLCAYRWPLSAFSGPKPLVGPLM